MNCYDNVNGDMTVLDHCKFHVPAKSETDVGYCNQPDKYRCLHDVNNHKLNIPLSYSSVSDYLTCHRLYYLKAIRGIVTRPAYIGAALKLGTLWDRALQKHLGNTEINIPAIIKEYEISDRDVAKVRGLYRAYKALDIQVEPGYQLQAEVNLKLSFDKAWTNGSPIELPVTGFYDRKYSNGFEEDKLTGHPTNYIDTWFIRSQVATYFLADPSLEYCIMKPVRTPDLRSTGRFKDESPNAYEERIYQDIISRPSFYFTGWDKQRRTYGKK